MRRVSGRLLATAWLLVLPWASPTQADDGEFRVRLVPSRVVASVGLEVQRGVRVTTAPFGPLRDWIKKKGYRAIGQNVVGSPSKAQLQKSPEELLRYQVEVDYAKGELPAGEGHIRLVRLPAALVLERSFSELGGLLKFLRKATPIADPPKEELEQRGLVAAGGSELEFPPDASLTGTVPIVMRWYVRPKGRADVGLYTDAGAHPNAVKTAAAAVIDAGLTVVPLDAGHINDGSFRKRVRCLLMPGGWAVNYKEDITPRGTKHVRQFFEKGGGYVGICAGAFYAAQTVRWKGIKYDYPLGLLTATAVGPIEKIAPWPKHALAKLRVVKGHPLTKGLYVERQAFYLGGCYFKLGTDSRDAAQVVARYAEGDKPAIITFRRKKGRAFLSGVHIEYDLTSDRDDLTWPESEGALKDPEPDWDLFQRGLRWAVGKKK